MKKNYILSPVLLLLAFVFASCEKDNQLEDGLIPIYCEPLGNSTKVSVIDDVKSRWVEGDEISINGQTTQVLFSNGQACVRYTADANSVNRAVYPASMVGESTSFASDAIEVTFPAEYHYREADGHQQIEIPMVAKSTGTDALQFKHLTGALCVQLYNNSGTEVLVRSVTIASDNSQLSGPCTVDVYTAAITTRVTDPTSAQKKVTLLFDHGLKVTNGNTRKVLIPVLPVGDGNHFTVTVDFCQPSELSHAFRFTKTQPSGGALPRNILGYAKTELKTSGDEITTQQLIANNGESYYISTPLDLYLVANAINSRVYSYPDCYYYRGDIYIQNDIDMSGITITPITNFQGVLHGNNHIISNLTIKSTRNSNDYYCALFYNNSSNCPNVYYLTLQDLCLLHESNAYGTLTMGGLYAVYDGQYTLSNCNVNIKEMKNTGSVAGEINVGGLIGVFKEGIDQNKNVYINDCDVCIQSAIINGSNVINYGNYIGNVPLKYSPYFSGCSSLVDVTLTTTSSVRIGGFVGIKNKYDFSATNCSILGTINANVGGNYNYVGNLVGKYSNVEYADLITYPNNNISFTVKKNGVNVNITDLYNQAF